MPQIFDEAGREKVRIHLINEGFELIKKYGLKKTSVSDIAKAAGIATGTFYNFFKTKEEFVYQIVVYKREMVKNQFRCLLKDEMMDKETFRKFLKTINLTDHNIFEYLDEREISMLNARWPEEYWKNSDKDETTATWMLSHLKDKRPDCDWKVYSNLSKSISLIRYGQVRLYQEKFEETLDIYIDAIIRYIFGD